MAAERMPLASRKRALELGAGFIEDDLAKMRATARGHDEQASEVNQVWPVTHSLEHDLMKAAEWASAAATLRALAAQEVPS